MGDFTLLFFLNGVQVGHNFTVTGLEAAINNAAAYLQNLHGNHMVWIRQVGHVMPLATVCKHDLWNDRVTVRFQGHLDVSC